MKQEKDIGREVQFQFMVMEGESYLGLVKLFNSFPHQKNFIH